MKRTFKQIQDFLKTSLLIFSFTLFYSCEEENFSTQPSESKTHLWTSNEKINASLTGITCTLMNDHPSGMHRNYAASFTIDEKGYLATGAEGQTGQYLKDLWQYEPSTDTWTQMAFFPGVPRIDAVAFAVNKKGYLGTGIDAFGTIKNDLYEYTPPPINTWVVRKPIPGAPRYAAVGFALANRGYIATGFSGTTDLKEVWEYTPASDPASNDDSWTQQPDFPGKGRKYATCFVIGRRAYVGLGIELVSGEIFKDFYIFSPTQDPATWKRISSFPSTARFGTTGFSLSGKGYVGGGLQGSPGTPHLEMWSYDPAAEFWSKEQNIPGTNGIVFGTSFTIGSSAYTSVGEKVYRFQ